MSIQKYLNGTLRYIPEANETEWDGQVTGILDDLIDNINTISEAWQNVKNYGATGDGITDDTASIQSAINSCTTGGTVYLPKGDYSISSALSLITKVNLILDSESVIKKNFTGIGTYAIQAIGTLGSSSILTANVSKGATSIEVTSSTSFSIGDIVLLQDDTYVSSPNGHNQEILKISAIVSNTITVSTYTYGSYLTSNTATLYKISAIVDSSISGGRIVCPTVAHPTYNGGGIYLKYAYGFSVDKVIVDYPDSRPGIMVEVSSYGSIKNCFIRDGQNAVAGGSYGLGIELNEAVSNVSVINNNTANINQNTFSNLTRSCCFSHNKVNGAADSCFNTHGASSESISILGNELSGGYFGICLAFNGATGIDNNISVVGNVITNCGSSAITCIGNTSGGNDVTGVVIANNVIKNYSCNLDGQYGIVVNYALDAVVLGNIIDGSTIITGHDPGAGIGVFNTTGTIVSSNSIRNLSVDGYGIRVGTSADCLISGNVLKNISSYNIYLIASTARVINNIADDNSNSIDGDCFQIGNSWSNSWTIGASEPTKGTWKISDASWNSSIVAGGYMGWGCVTAGGAKSTTRANSTAYSLYVWVLWTTGTTIWECTTAGTTDSSPPSIVGKVVGDTVVDGGVTWTCRSLTTAVFKTFGAITA